MALSMSHRQYSLTGRTCCICDRPCAILDCQCLENFQQNTSEHGSLMKRLTSAFSIPVVAKDLHSFSLCCSCEHHLVVIEQANRIKECIKQVFLETKAHRNFVSSHLMKHGKPPNAAIMRQKRLSSAIDSRSFDEASPRVKKSRVASSSSFPTTTTYIASNLLSPKPQTTVGNPTPSSQKVFSFDESQLVYKIPKVDWSLSFDSVFSPNAASAHQSMLAPPDKVEHVGTTTTNMESSTTASNMDSSNTTSASHMEYEEPGIDSKYVPAHANS